MTRQPEPLFDQRIADWLEDDPIPGAGDTLESVLAAFPAIAQRRGRMAPRRPLAIDRRAYLAAGIAAVLIVAVAGGSRLNTSPPTGGPSPTTSVAPSPSVTASPIARLRHNGLVAVVRAGALALVDPMTGKTTKVLLQAPATHQDTGAVAATGLSWAPDGRRLAYVSADGPIHVIDVSTGADERILNCGIEVDGCGIAWAPDGGRIAVTVRTQIQLIDPDGGNRQVIDTFAAPVGMAWSPDGLRIAVTANDGLMVVDRDGSNLTTLIEPVQGIGVGNAVWAPDGKSIAYLGSTDHQSCPTFPAKGSCQDDWQLHLMVVDLDGSKPRELMEAGVCFCLGFAPGLTWSPDGTSLAMVIPSSDVNPWGLHIVNADGSGKRFVSDAWGPVAWQPVP